MLNADVIGTRAILQVIEQSGHTKFLIRNAGDARNMPVIYEATHTKTNKEAAKDFSLWSEAMTYGGQKNNKVYEILLFSSDADAADENETETKAGQRKKIKFTFQFHNEAGSMQPQNVISGMQPTDIAGQIEAAVELALTKREIEELRQENEELRQELDAVGETQPLDQLNELFDKIENFKGGKKPERQPEENAPASEMAAVAGLDAKADVERIKKALQIIAKYDNDLAGDLERLAKLAETNNGQFTFVINALRNMIK